MRGILLGAMMLALFTACGCSRTQQIPPVVDLQDYVFESTLEHCRLDAIDFAGDMSKSSRRSYFELCMANNGYGQETYKHLWINL